MSTCLRVAVADDDADTRDYLREALGRMGHEVVAAAASGGELCAACRESPPDLIVTDIMMPDMDGLEAVATLGSARPVPVVVVSAHHDDAQLTRAGNLPVMGYLVKPFTEGHLKAAVTLAMKRFRAFQELQQEAADLRQALEDRKVIERGKGVLMRRLQLDEFEAYRRLRGSATGRHLKLVEVAREVIAADSVLAEFDPGRAGPGN